MTYHYNGTAERVTIFGFGAQGKAWALNLQDSGFAPVVYLRPESPRAAMARDAGLTVIHDPKVAAQQCSAAVLLLPDSEQSRFYREVLAEHLPHEAALVFAHGFALHYGEITPRPDLDTLLAAPLAHGDAVRSGFSEGVGAPCVLAVAQDATGRAEDRLQHLARGVCLKGPFIASTVAEEVEIDLFAEQAVLCGGVPELAKASFDTLVENGYQEEIAYFCCLSELRAIVDLLYRHAITGMRSRISDTARYGAVTRGKRIIDDHVRTQLREILSEIRSGRFAHELIEANREGQTELNAEMARDREHAMERIHRKYRS